SPLLPSLHPSPPVSSPLSLHDALPIYIHGIHVESLLDFGTQGLRPRLCPVDPDAQRTFAWIQALTDKLISDIEHVRWRHHDDVEIGRAHVLTPVTSLSRMPSSA